MLGLVPFFLCRWCKHSARNSATSVLFGCSCLRSVYAVLRKTNTTHFVLQFGETICKVLLYKWAPQCLENIRLVASIFRVSFRR